MHSSLDARASHPSFRVSVNARVTPRRRLDPRKTTRIPNIRSLLPLSSSLHAATMSRRRVVQNSRAVSPRQAQGHQPSFYEVAVWKKTPN